MIKVLAYIYFLLLSILSYSQNLTLSGFIYDSQSKERLINATIYNIDAHSGCNSNEQGYYSLTVQKGLTILKVSYIGYSPDTFKIQIHTDTFIIFHLHPSDTIREITVTGQSSHLSYNAEKIQISVITKLPVIAGEADIMKTLQLLPGIQSTSEGQAGFSVMGGDDYQNLILLDGVPVYNPYHLFGFFSIFNDKALQDITLYTGDFPARYGGRLSSVLDIQTKEGNSDHICGSTSVGLLASSANLEGPLFNNKTTFFISGRISYLDFIAAPLIKYFSGYDAASYQFYDVNAKITHRFNNMDKLIFSFYRSYDYGQTSNADDYSYFIQDQSVSWGNLLGSITWSHIVDSKLFLNTIAHYSKYEYFSGNSYDQSFGNSSSTSQNKYQSTIYDAGLNLNMTWFNSSILTMRGGVGYTFQMFYPGVESSYSSNINSTGQLFQESNSVANMLSRSSELDCYSDNDIHVLKNMTLHAGLRYTIYQNAIIYNNLDPRFNLEYNSGKLKIGLSYTLAHQYTHLLTTSNIAEATDLWVPSTKGILPESSMQYSINSDYLLNKSFIIKGVVYYKKFTNLLAYQDGASYLTATSWQDVVTTGTGFSRGLSLTIEKKIGKTTGWITYTLSKTQRQFTLINNGNPFPFDFDHRNDFKFVLMHSFSTKLDGSLTWLYHTGNFVSYGNIMDEGMYVYVSRNGYELPAYQRLDLDLNYHIRTKKRESIITFGIYNVYNYKNIYNIEFFNNNILNGIGPNQPAYIVIQQSLFPIIPSITYRINFN